MGCPAVTSGRRWEQFLGSGAGLSASAITRLTRAEWRQGPRHLMASLLTRGRCEGIVLIDDPASTQITVNGRTRPAALGEPHSFGRLAEELQQYGSIPVRLQADFDDSVSPRTAVIMHALGSPVLSSQPVAVRRRTVLVGLSRHAIPDLLVGGLGGAVDNVQYLAWRTGERADAAICGRLSLAPRLRGEVTAVPFGSGRFGRLQVTASRLPELLAAYLGALI